jgi:hypothetical protein
MTARGKGGSRQQGMGQQGFFLMSALEAISAKGTRLARPPLN